MNAGFDPTCLIMGYLLRAFLYWRITLIVITALTVLYAILFWRKHPQASRYAPFVTVSLAFGILMSVFIRDSGPRIFANIFSRRTEITRVTSPDQTVDAVVIMSSWVIPAIKDSYYVEIVPKSAKISESIDDDYNHVFRAKNVVNLQIKWLDGKDIVSPLMKIRRHILEINYDNATIYYFSSFNKRFETEIRLAPAPDFSS